MAMPLAVVHHCYQGPCPVMITTSVGLTYTYVLCSYDILGVLNIFTLYGIRLAVTMHCERSSALSVRVSVYVLRTLVNR